MISDYHLHSNFSGDSKTPPEEIIERAIELGMEKICFTDHCDFDINENRFVVDLDAYFPKMQKMQEKYQDQIDIRIGVELGLQTYLAKKHHEYVNKYPFDFVIGSVHVVNGEDPYYAGVFEGKGDGEIYQAYFEQMLLNLNAFTEFQVLGHLDYIVRYGRNKAKEYSYQKYAELIDEILKKIISKNLGIEINTGGFRNKIEFAHPHPDVIRRYKELGGEIITVGSDAHDPIRVGDEFERTRKLLKEIGFKYYATFKERKIEYNTL